MSKALAGIRVIDWTVFQQGPVATSMLGDLGADVIKIENLTGGDPGRGVKRLHGSVNCEIGRGLNYYFETNNRNKKGIALDLTKSKGKEVVYRLVGKSDAFVQNFRLGIATKLGLDYDTLREHNPRLIYCSASGFGLKGPDASLPALDFTAQARAGLMYLAGEPDEGPHILSGGIADQLGAIITAYGILVALLARERNGIGQEINVSLLSSMLWLEGLMVPAITLFNQDFPRFSKSDAKNPLFNYYQCSDGKVMVLALFQSDRYWPDFCRALGIQELERDFRFANEDKRRENNQELIGILNGIFARKTCQEWETILSQNKDFIFQRARTLLEVYRDPQVIQNDYLTDFNHPVLGKMKLLNCPVQLSKTPATIEQPAPAFGQHTEEILTQVCGYSWDEVTKMKEEGVIP